MVENLKIGNNLRFITPLERTEISLGNTINIKVLAENAYKVSLYFKNLQGVWVFIHDALLVNNEWVYVFTPSEIPTRLKAVAEYHGKPNKETYVSLWGIGLLDSFTDVNGTNILTHTPDEVFYQGWTVESGNWEIQDNKLTCTNTDGNYNFIVTEGTENCLFDFVIESPSTNGGDHILALKFTDENNWIKVLIRSDRSVEIGQFVDGIYTLYIDTPDTAFFRYTDLMRVFIVDGYFHIANVTKKQYVMFNQKIIENNSATKYGFARPNETGGATYKYDYFRITPIHLPETTSTPNYNVSKLDSLTIVKNQFDFDTSGVSSPTINKVDGKYYMLFTCQGGLQNSGVTFATSDLNTPHDWTRHNGLIISQYDNPSDGTIIDTDALYVDGVWYVIYSDADAGVIKYATGTELTSLTKRGSLLPAFTGNLYQRHPSLFKHNDLFYLFIDVRRDQSYGHIGDIWVGVSETIEGFATAEFHEVLSAPGFNFDVGDLTAPDVRFNANTGLFEMLYSSFNSGGEPYYHQICLAVSDSPLNPFVRVANNPLIPTQNPSDIDYVTTTPCWMPGTNHFYYTCKTSGGSKDGISYGTLTS